MLRTLSRLRDPLERLGRVVLFIVALPWVAERAGVRRGSRTRPRAGERVSSERLSARIATLVAILVIPHLTACFLASEPGVLVIVNSKSPVSVSIGAAYAESRGIPPEHVLKLSIPVEHPDLSDDAHESISRPDFDRWLREPIERFLRERDLVDDIEIIVTTKGIPLKIEGAQVAHDVMLRDSTRASVDAELSLLFSSAIGSAGVEQSMNPYYDSGRTFREFRSANPGSPLRYMVARLTGYAGPLDPDTRAPRDVQQLMDSAVAPPAPEGVWLIDQDPTLSAGLDAGNKVLLEPAAAVLEAVGLRVRHDRSAGFQGAVRDIQGYASWGSNDGHDPPPSTYGDIEGRRYPGYFAARSLSVDFVSTNARTFSRPPRYGQSLIADLIALGTAGASGHVGEPTLPAVARPHILLRRYAQGRIAIEAYYRAIPYLGWMNTYVGDPLMRLEEPPAREDPEDLDGDSVPDSEDNCTVVPNLAQRDTDGDGFGNICDPDVDGDGRVSTSWGAIYPLGARGDVEWIALTAKNGPYDPDHDLDGDGAVDARDISIAQLYLFLAPGPAAD